MYIAIIVEQARKKQKTFQANQILMHTLDLLTSFCFASRIMTCTKMIFSNRLRNSRKSFFILAFVYIY